MHSVAVCGERVFAPCHDGHVYAVSAKDGKAIWKFKAGAGFWASPCCAAGQVFIGSRDGVFYAIDQKSGKLAWSYKVGEKIHQTAAFRGGKVTFGAENGRVYMLDGVTGKELWKTDPFPTISFRYTWPVFVENAVVYSPIPSSNTRWFYGFNLDAKAIGWSERAPEDVSKLPPGATDHELIRRYLDKNVDRQCVYIIDVNTGRLKSTAPAFVFMAVPQPAPAVTLDGTMILAHSGWHWGETSPAFLARMRIGREKTEIEDFLIGCKPGIISAFFPSDIRCHLSGSGHILFVSCATSGAYNLDTDQRIALPKKPGGSGSDVLSGIIPAEGKLFHVSNGELFCQTTRKGN